MTKTRHKRTAVVSMFQNGISRNTKCAERDGFCREGHKCCNMDVLRVLLIYLHSPSGTQLPWDSCIYISQTLAVML